MKEELIKKLAEARKGMKAYLGRDLTEEETEKLAGLNADAAKYAAQIEALTQQEAAEAEDEARIKRERDAAVKAARDEERAAARRLAFEGAPYVAKFADTNKFDNLSASETALVIDVLKSQRVEPSPAAFKALSLKVAALSEEDRYVKSAFKASTNIEPTKDAIEAAVKAATDPMYSTGSTIGSDWVGTAYSNEIWRKIRAENVVLSRIPEDVVPDGFSSKYWPLESTDPTWYKVSEATAADATMGVPVPTVTASQVATANKQITLGKLGARIMYTQELLEDSLVNTASQLREQLVASGMEILEHVAIDGDTNVSTNTNINDIGGNPAGTEPFLLVDGFRKLPLITNSANSRSAGGAFVVEDFRDTLKLLGAAGVNADPTKVSFVIDYNTMWAAMSLPEIKTRDVFSAATLENGVLTRVYNYPVINANQMHRLAPAGYERKADSAGKVNQDTAANNAYGAILAVRFDQWRQAFKRRMTIETTRIANADSWEIVALLRWGMAYRDTEASAITYYVGV
jgi:hypothetical protein